MPYAITAEFPLGYYQGHTETGTTERYPSILRLHAALVGAAYARQRLHVDETTLLHATHPSSPSDAATKTAVKPVEVTELDAQARQALTWLEHHAPDAITLPRTWTNSGRGAKAYRRKGWSQNVKADGPDNPAAAEDAVGRTALAAPVTWWWSDNPPESVAHVLADLCGEVPYLGERQSVVRLYPQQAESIPDTAYTRADDAPISAANVLTFDAPAPGRSDALQADYERGVKAKYPTRSADRPRNHTTANAESDLVDTWDASAITRQVPYQAPQSDIATNLPWTIGYLVRVEPLHPGNIQYWRPRPDIRVEWALAVHRALVKLLGSDATPLITGRYPAGDRQPANRAAIQILDAGLPLNAQYSTDLNGRLGSAQILVALPPIGRGTTPEDIDMVEDALRRLKMIAIRTDEVIAVTSIDAIDITRLWAPREPDMQRWWFPHPLMIAENRAPKRSLLTDHGWSPADAIRVSIGNVFRDQLPPIHEHNTDHRQILLSQAVRDAGARIGGAHRADPVNPQRYVHRINPNAVITALQGLIHLGPLSPESAFTAIGQSRHLGGGLLVPSDLPEPSAISYDSQGGDND